MKRSPITLLLLVLLFVLAACGGAGSEAPASQSGAREEAAIASDEAAEDSFLAPELGDVAESEAAAPDGGTDASGGDPAQSNLPVLPFERMIIKNADLTLKVDDIPAVQQAITRRVQQLGGYVIQAQMSGDDEATYGYMSVRVPADQFDTALNGIEETSTDVLSRDVSGDDVTEEFVDLQSRLRSLEATRDRLYEFLDRAESVEEALAVNRNLTELESQIEQVKGRLQFLEQSAAMSTINVTLQREAETPLPVTATWSPLDVAGDAFTELVVFGQGVLSVIIVLFVWLPVWGIPALGTYLLFRHFSRPRPHHQPPLPPASPPAAQPGNEGAGS